MTHPEIESKSGLFTLRLWDMLDGWIDVKCSIPWNEALELWNKYTKNGTKNTKYSDGDYYCIFPDGTEMIITPEFLGR